MKNFIGALSQGVFLAIDNLNLKSLNEKSYFNIKIEEIMTKLK